VYEKFNNSGFTNAWIYETIHACNNCVCIYVCVYVTNLCVIQCHHQCMLRYWTSWFKWRYVCIEEFTYRCVFRQLYMYASMKICRSAMSACTYTHVSFRHMISICISFEYRSTRGCQKFNYLSGQSFVCFTSVRVMNTRIKHTYILLLFSFSGTRCRYFMKVTQ